MSPLSLGVSVKVGYEQQTGRLTATRGAAMRGQTRLHRLLKPFQADLDMIAATAEPSMRALRGRRIFLTGCTGFIGKWLINSLLWGNETLALQLGLIVVTRDAARFLEAMPHLRCREDVVFVQGTWAAPRDGDIPDFDLAVHALNIYPAPGADWQAKHMGELVRAADALYGLAAAKGCSTVLFTSSGAVYGTGQCAAPPYAEEQIPLVPSAPAGDVYGETKRFLEKYCVALGSAHDIRTVVARCFAFAGAHFPLNGHNALGTFIEDAHAGRDIYIQGDGKEIRSYLYAADMAVWLLTLLASGGHGKAYNVGSERAVSLEDLAWLILRCAGSSAGVVIGNGRTQGNAPAVYVADTRRIREEFGLVETVSLEKALVSTLAWHKRVTQEPNGS